MPTHSQRLKRRRLRWIAALALAGSGPAFADDAQPIKNIEEVDLEALLGTVTAASRTEESVLTAPATVTVLNQDDIRHSAATTIPDLLRKVPGVQVLELAPGDYLVSLRGMGGLTGNNVVVLLDGTPLNSRIDGNVDWGSIPIDLSQVDRIEVVRGPVSTIYGPDAYTGVINIVSLPVSENHVGGSSHLAGGIDSSGRPAGIIAGTVSGTRGKLSGRVSLNGRFDQTFSGAATTPAWATSGATAFVQYAPSEGTTLSMEVGGSFSRRSALDHLILESLPQDSTFLFGTLRLKVTKLPSMLDSLELWGRVRTLEIRDNATFAGFSYGGANSADEEVGFDLRFALPHQFKLAVGGFGGFEFVDAPFIHPLENGRLRGRYGFYLDAGWDFRNKLSISGAARADVSELANGLHFAGRGSVIYHAQKYALRLTIGGAYRDPTYVEVAGRFTDPKTNLILLEGTPGLNPPQITSIEVGAIVAPWGTLTIKPTLFVAQLTNLMVENFEPLVRKTFLNEQTARWVMGGELEASLQVRKELSLEANVVGMYWLTNPTGMSPTVGTPAQNSLVTAWAGARSNLHDGRIGLSLGAGYTSQRTYNLRAGIPPLLLSAKAPDLVRIEAAADYKLSAKAPVWLSLKVMSHIPHDAVESPFPGSSLLGTSVFLALDVR